jgi:hypothetical protein
MLTKVNSLNRLDSDGHLEKGGGRTRNHDFATFFKEGPEPPGDGQVIGLLRYWIRDIDAVCLLGRSFVMKRSVAWVHAARSPSLSRNGERTKVLEE